LDKKIKAVFAQKFAADAGKLKSDVDRQYNEKPDRERKKPPRSRGMSPGRVETYLERGGAMMIEVIMEAARCKWVAEKSPKGRGKAFE